MYNTLTEIMASSSAIYPLPFTSDRVSQIPGTLLARCEWHRGDKALACRLFMRRAGRGTKWSSLGERLLCNLGRAWALAIDLAKRLRYPRSMRGLSIPQTWEGYC